MYKYWTEFTYGLIRIPKVADFGELRESSKNIKTKNKFSFLNSGNRAIKIM